jgi:hypothetical protein
MVAFKVKGTFLILAVIAILGAILTTFALPETKEMSLREVGQEDKYIEDDKISVAASAATHKA